MAYRPPTLDAETDGLLEDYCEASGDENKNKIIQKAIYVYVLTQIGRNEGIRERYVELRVRRSRPKDEKDD